MSSSCDTTRSPRVLRGAAASRAPLHELPVEPAGGARVDGPAAREAAARAGFEAGFAEGLRAGRQQAVADAAATAAQVATLVRQLGGAVQDLAARTAAELGAVEDAIVAGALDLAEAVIGREVDQRRAGPDAVARALALAPRGVEVTLHVHPADVEIVEAGGLPAGVTLVADATVGPGGCLALVGDCTIDARLGAALERAREALR